MDAFVDDCTLLYLYDTRKYIQSNLDIQFTCHQVLIPGYIYLSIRIAHKDTQRQPFAKLQGN